MYAKIILLLYIILFSYGLQAQTKQYSGVYKISSYIEGNATYSYMEINDQRIYEGEFTFSTDYVFGSKISIYGNFKNDRRDGRWQVVVNNQKTIGNYNNGQLSGECKYSAGKSVNPNALFDEQCVAHFENNHFVGSFSYKRNLNKVRAGMPNKLSIKGDFDEKGHLTGEWILEYSHWNSVVYKERRNYYRGLLIELKKTDTSTGKVIHEYNNDDAECFMRNTDSTCVSSGDYDLVDCEEDAYRNKNFTDILYEVLQKELIQNAYGFMNLGALLKDYEMLFPPFYSKIAMNRERRNLRLAKQDLEKKRLNETLNNMNDIADKLNKASMLKISEHVKRIHNQNPNLYKLK